MEPVPPIVDHRVLVNGASRPGAPIRRGRLPEFYEFAGKTGFPEGDCQGL